MASMQADTHWQVNANGFNSILDIDAVTTTGKVEGTIQDDNGKLPLENASWNENARALAFTRTLPNGENHTFIGFLFDTSGADSTFTMAGTFKGDRFEDPRRLDFGWYAFGNPDIG